MFYSIVRFILIPSASNCCCSCCGHAPYPFLTVSQIAIAIIPPHRKRIPSWKCVWLKRRYECIIISELWLSGRLRKNTSEGKGGREREGRLHWTKRHSQTALTHPEHPLPGASADCGHQRRSSKWAELWCRHILFAFSSASASASASTSWSYISDGRTSCSSHQRQRAGLGRAEPTVIPFCFVFCFFVLSRRSPKPKSRKARTGLGHPYPRASLPCPALAQLAKAAAVASGRFMQFIFTFSKRRIPGAAFERSHMDMDRVNVPKCVCICVRVREREREVKEREGEGDGAQASRSWSFFGRTVYAEHCSLMLLLLLLLPAPKTPPHHSGTKLKFKLCTL